MGNISFHKSVSTAEPDRQFQHDVLLGGGFSTIPRWSREPIFRVGECKVKVPDEIVASLDRLANDLAIPLGSVLLAGHAKVLSTLSGEREVLTGYVREPGSALPLRMSVRARTWREMLWDVARSERELAAYGSSPVDDLRCEIGVKGAQMETVFESKAGSGGEFPLDSVLRVSFLTSPGLVLGLRYKMDVLDAECAARIGGYYSSALALIAADPDAEHGRQCLLSAEELRFQLHGLAGRSRKLPDRRVHELVEEQARTRPNAIAGMYGAAHFTYRKLNAQANRLARALLLHGLSPEGIVGVVTQRNLDWMTAVLAIFKAGGAYMPIDPHFPADRIVRMLSRAGCRLVIDERSTTDMLDQALTSLGGIERVSTDAAYDECYSDTNLDVPVAPDQLAYIYFTSGSTGEPKGVMCEHLGLLNHVFAKTKDLGVGKDSVVAQTAPQCFDISLWQLISALLVGGRTLLVEQEAILDAKHFVDRISDGKVNVIQVVPSYLEVLVTYLEQQPRTLPDLQFVSVTGETLNKKLVERWFVVQPGIRLVNSYGVTEASDDTNHEIMDSAPCRDNVPLGRPIDNISIYVINEHLSLVPLGAPGEIVFAGVCVGRGYINDPERTRQVFVTDPHVEGQRLYRSGDFGHWLPEGKLEFLGRRDAQVKIRGFRIEMGEIENTLLRVPGVRESAVVVIERADGSKHLLAFYSGQRPIGADALREQLSASLPEYMVPAAFHWRNRLPLTENGKTDKKALTVLAGELDVAEPKCERPSTATEQWLVAAWAEVLGIPKEKIGRRDHFFDLGGTSLSALKLAVTLDRVASFKDLIARPILADQAELVDRKLEQGSPAAQTQGRISAAARDAMAPRPGEES